MTYTFFALEREDGLLWVWLNRPEKRNFLNLSFWEELPLLVEEIALDKCVKVVCLAAKGSSFSMGLDISEFALKFSELFFGESAAHRQQILELIEKLQKGIKSLLGLEKPVLACVHRHCIGGGLDLIAACDIRLCSRDAIFSLKESELHIVADMGSLQLLPYIIGEARTRELAFTGRDISSEEALQMGLVNRVFEDKESMWQEARKLGLEMAKKDPLVLKGIKAVLNERRNYVVNSSLRHVALWNSAFLQNESFLALIEKWGKRKS
ncbi:MAG: enoyl-CoA hydratase-related protein [Leptospiraceae bacterium]|nr:enoyl-CoA hydratase-related protein [Leptospiraceae bacterium]MDW8307643.1 enoyl-CoA hydratase-related protein [Leptospiraceae bacterium]